MIRLCGQLICQTSEQTARVAHHLPEHTRLSRAEAGCIRFDVRQTDDPLIWQVDETFTDRAAFDAHQQRTRASVWWAATADIRREFTVSDS